MTAAELILSNLTYDLQRFVDFVAILRERADDANEKSLLFGISSAAERLLIVARIAEDDAFRQTVRLLFSSEASTVRPDLFPTEGGAS